MVPKVSNSGKGETASHSNESEEQKRLLDERQSSHESNMLPLTGKAKSSRGLFRWWKGFFGKMKSFLNRRKSAGKQMSVSIDDDTATDYDSGVDDGMATWDVDYGTFDEPIPDIRQPLAKQFQALVAQHDDMSEHNDHVTLLSDALSLRLAEAVIKESVNEPCGLRGCRVLLYACFHGDKGATDHAFIGNLYPEAGLFATFEVILTLHTRRISALSRCWSKSIRRYCGNFDIVKEKLYTCSSGRSSTQPSPGPGP